MSFDPTKPVEGTLCDALEMRAQLNGLHDEIIAATGVSAAIVDSVQTLPPGSPATATVSLSSSELHFTFALPAGVEGATGPPGEVTQAQLSNDLVNNANATFNTILPLTSANSNAVLPLEIPYAAPEKEELRLKIQELILALRR